MSIAQAMQLNPQGAQVLMARFDMVQMEVDRAKALGLPTKYIVSEEEFQKAQEELKQQLQQQQTLQGLNSVADTAQKIGNTPGGEDLTKQMFSQMGGQMSGQMDAMMEPAVTNG